jgi:hypothetical protein
MRGRHCGPIRVEDVIHARAMFIRERLGQRQLHDPVHPPKTMGVVGHEVVLHKAPIFHIPSD